jgi:hypothetical protein
MLTEGEGNQRLLLSCSHTAWARQTKGSLADSLTLTTAIRTCPTGVRPSSLFQSERKSGLTTFSSKVVLPNFRLFCGKNGFGARHLEV